MATVREQSSTLEDQPAFWLQADGATATPVVYLHGVPSSADDWRPFLERIGGIAPDLPGFGRAGKRGDLPATMGYYDGWIERFLDHAGVDGSFSLVVHDWGSVGLLTAQRLAGRIERLVVVNAIPLLPGFRWRRIARVWRTPVAGEIAMGLTMRPAIRALLDGVNVTRLPDEMIDGISRYLDVGTQRSILRLYRSAPPDALAAAGAQLTRLTCPALVVWGDHDPYIPSSFADAYAAALGGEAEVRHLPDAGHWPWLDRPGLVEDVAAFLGC